MTATVIPTRVQAIDEHTSYPTVVIDAYDALKCAAPCNNTPEGSGFEYAPNGDIPFPVDLGHLDTLDGIYVCLACGTVIDIKPTQPAPDLAPADMETLAKVAVELWDSFGESPDQLDASTWTLLARARTHFITTGRYHAG